VLKKPEEGKIKEDWNLQGRAGEKKERLPLEECQMEIPCWEGKLELRTFTSGFASDTLWGQKFSDPFGLHNV
jgi:hypothetical protein